MIRIILVSVFIVLFAIAFAFSTIKKSNKSKESKSDECFVVRLPDFCCVIGLIECCVVLILMIAFTVFSKEIPHLIFYIVFGSFYAMGMYLIIKTKTFKVVVENERITVFSALKKPYTFCFNDIISVVRQVKKNKVNSERMVIKTIHGKRIIVENAEISYNKFLKRIQTEVDTQYLSGFQHNITLGDGSVERLMRSIR